MRVFLAIEPDTAALARLGHLADGVRVALGDAASALRWTPAANLHITLHFLGDLDPARLALMRDVIGDRLPGPPFEAATADLGTFPDRGPLRTLWVSIGAGREGVVAVHRELRERLLRAGTEVEERAFTPHLTLARARNRDSRPAPFILRRLSAVSAPSVSWRVDHATLFASDLSGPAPRYRAIQTVQLT
jgi:2'-5' RNA ligase